MKKKEIITQYRNWRKQYRNHKPNRAIVRMHWEDESPDHVLTDTIALQSCDAAFPWDDDRILFYAHGLAGLLQLTESGNGSGFVITEVVQFYKEN